MASSVVSDNFETSTGAIPNIGGADITTRLCSAWVNFDGTGTVAINASYNVSSITDNGVGIYTVNFTTALPDIDFSLNVTSPLHASDRTNTVPRTTSSCQVYTYNFAGGSTDYDPISVQIIR